jgi:[ribosomal protein S5]-alanine N-acetyltransferase
MRILETERLSLRELNADDAVFILELLNEPAFIQNIADRGVRTIADARVYIEIGPIASYEKFGFGLYLVELKESDIPIGMCGLLKRDYLEDIDIGYAFLERFWSKGYAYESASAVMGYARNILKLRRVVATTTLDNQGSIRVLEKMGFKFDKIITLPGYAEGSRLFVLDIPSTDRTT